MDTEILFLLLNLKWNIFFKVSLNKYQLATVSHKFFFFSLEKLRFQEEIRNLDECAFLSEEKKK